MDATNAPKIRHILVDTETTGLEPKQERMVEFAAVETIDFMPTGRKLHLLMDPERDVPVEATRIHGHTRADLIGKPVFSELADEIVDFVSDGIFVAHNAPFDLGFLNEELRRAGRRRLSCKVIDTMAEAKRQFPNSKYDLDSLCRRFKIDLSVRKLHGALVDATLLAEVFLNLNGGRHRMFDVSAGPSRLPTTLQGGQVPSPADRGIRTLGLASDDEIARHDAFVASNLVNKKEPDQIPYWRRLAA